jgi:hypothetical protein
MRNFLIFVISFLLFELFNTTDKSRLSQTAPQKKRMPDTCCGGKKKIPDNLIYLHVNDTFSRMAAFAGSASDVLQPAEVDGPATDYGGI